MLCSLWLCSKSFLAGHLAGRC